MNELINMVALCAAFTDPSFFMSKSKASRTCDLMPVVISEAKKNNIDPFLLIGLISTESSWEPSVVSHANACGLTQVVPRFTGGPTTGGVKYTCEELKDPNTSIRVGAQTLAWWVNQYGNGDIATGLCGYFSGFRCKPELNKLGEAYYKKVLAQKQKVTVIYSKFKNNN
jgi:soluble lytic murein transglycosylase